jgi:protein-S-isoprenylcysteine O-methyltransferase Ste14
MWDLPDSQLPRIPFTMLDSRTMRASVPAIAIPTIVILLYFFLPGLKDQPWTVLRIACAFLALIGYILVLTARVQLGRSFSVRPEAKELVSHGLYSRIRNPMYVFLDLMVIGLIFVLRLHWLLVVLAVLAFFQARQARREARVLEGKFGQTYLDYRNGTWF